MLNKYIIVFIIGIFFIERSGYAENLDQSSGLDPVSAAQLIELCKHSEINNFETENSEGPYSAKDVIFIADEKKVLLKLLKTSFSEDFGSVADLTKLLTSVRENQTLTECFGDDETKKNIFTIKLILADRLGHLLSALSYYLPVKAFNTILKSSAFSALTVRFPTSYAIIIKSLKILKVAGISLATLAGAYLLLNQWFKMQYLEQSTEQTNELQKANDEFGYAIFELLKEEINDYRAQLEIETSELKKQELREKIKKNEASISKNTYSSKHRLPQTF